MRCPACQRPIDDDSLFCAQCGAPVSDASAATYVPAHQLLERLHGDSDGTTYRAKHLQAGVERLVRVENGTDAARQRRVRERAAVLLRTSPPGVLRLHECFALDRGETALVIERPKGRPAKEVSERWGPLALAEVVAVLRPVAEALEAVREAGGVLPPPFPAEVFLTREGRGWSVEVAPTDLGRQVAADPSLALREEVRSLARLACLLASGRLDVRDGSAARRELPAAGLPPAAVELLAAALDEEHGPPSPSDLVAALASAARATSARQRRPALTLALGAVALLVIAVVAVLLLRQPGSGNGAGASGVPGGLAAGGSSSPGRGGPVPATTAPASPAGPTAASPAGAAAGAPASPAGTGATAQSLRSLARVEVGEGDLAGAASWLDAALVAAGAPGAADRGTKLDLLNDTAVAAAAAGDLPRAEALLSELLALEPGDARALANRGVVRLAAGRLADAEADLRRSVASQPGSAAARTALADVLRQSGRLTAAREEIDSVLAASPDHGPALVVAAAVAREQGRWNEAVELYERAAKALPDEPVIAAELAATRAAAGR